MTFRGVGMVFFFELLNREFPCFHKVMNMVQYNVRVSLGMSIVGLTLGSILLGSTNGLPVLVHACLGVDNVK